MWSRFQCVFCLCMPWNVEKWKVVKNKAIYCGPNNSSHILAFNGSAIRIGILTTPNIIPKPCTILFTSSCLICMFEFSDRIWIDICIVLPFYVKIIKSNPNLVRFTIFLASNYFRKSSSYDSLAMVCCSPNLFFPTKRIYVFKCIIR
jgi:hypothetical protein